MTFDVQRARAQFPALNDSSRIFFDNPAGTQVPQGVIDAVSDYYRTMNANSGGAFATSQQSDSMVRAVRGQMARFLNAPNPAEVVFGQNMTTLNFALTRAIGQTLQAGDEIILTRMDHDANVNPWLRLADDHDLIVKWIDLNPTDCTLDLDSYEAALSEQTKMVAVVHASNAVGTINPIARIADMAHLVGAHVVVDAVQSAPHLPIDVQALGCDFLLCSAYKFFGPHIGILWGHYDQLATLPAYKVRPSKDQPPYRWETGTPSFETIAGVGAALTYLEALGGVAAFVPYERALVAHLIRVLKATPGVTIYGITDPDRLHERVPTVVFTLNGYTPEQVAQHLAAHQIYVWDGNYYAVEIMARLGHAEHGMVRVGLAHYNTHDEIDRFAQVLQQLT
ncbi:MAG: cysteine desulfurase-like protein [Anaerolineae bacterium]|jgi:cysteine desulfurase family protein (TIGR01976 family)|nr:cysteine desulfurase-like protein [Anaerolineae bacterium]